MTFSRLPIRLLLKICNTYTFKLKLKENSLKEVIILLIVSISLSCKKNNDLQKISDYKEFNRVAAHLTCEKIRDCYSYIYRTFPKNLIKSNRVEDCEDHILQNLDEKLKNHTDKIQYYARTCYTEILNTPCKNLPITVLTNPTCSALKRELKH